MISLHLLTTAEAAVYPEEYCRRHFPCRLARAQRFRFREDYLRCIGAGALLYEVLGIEESGLTEGVHGKPSCPGFGKEFNLSHSGDYIALAVSDTPVGVDIEKISERNLNIAPRVYQKEELLWMEELPEERSCRFHRLWTMKESVMKCFGEGLSMAPESFSVLDLLQKQETELNGKHLSAAETSVPGYRISVCTEGTDRKYYVTVINIKKH